MAGQADNCEYFGIPGGIVRLCKPYYEVFRGSTKGREKKRPEQIMEEQTWENGGEGGTKGVSWPACFSD